MAYDVVAMGPPQGWLWRVLAERFGDDVVTPGEGTVTLLLPDQSALVAVVGELHDHNITIEAVRRIEDRRTGPAAGPQI